MLATGSSNVNMEASKAHYVSVWVEGERFVACYWVSLNDGFFGVDVDISG